MLLPQTDASSPLSPSPPGDPDSTSCALTKRRLSSSLKDLPAYSKLLLSLTFPPSTGRRYSKPNFPENFGALGMRLPFALNVGSPNRSEEHTSELQSLMSISYAVFCLQKQKQISTIKNVYRNKSTAQADTLREIQQVTTIKKSNG